MTVNTQMLGNVASAAGDGLDPHLALVREFGRGSETDYLCIYINPVVTFLSPCVEMFDGHVNRQDGSIPSHCAVLHILQYVKWRVGEIEMLLRRS